MDITVSILWTAVIADALLGDPHWFPHPVRLFGNAIVRLEQNFRRRASSPRALRWYGFVLTLIVVGGAYAATWLILLIALDISYPLYWMAAAFLVYTTLAVRSLYRETWLVVRAVRKQDLVHARRLLSRVVGRDTDRLDQEGILRAVIETVAENLSDGVIAPLFYLALGGVPLAMAFKAASTIDSMIGYKNDPYQDIGKFGARLDDVANFIPARLTALLIILASAILRLDYRASWKIWRRDGRKHASPNAGHPEAAMAGALRIRLGGPSSYFGQVKNKPYLGDPDFGVTVDHARKAELVMLLASLIMILGISLLL